jgi:molybdate transport system regulatory protein
MAPRITPRLTPGLTGRVKGWLTLDGEFLLGPRYVQLLEGIDRTGTIREGCQATRMSYRTCLSRIRRMEAAVGAPLVLTHRGGAARGSASLTPLARRLVRIYREWREALDQASNAAFAQVLGAGRPTRPDARSRTPRRRAQR